MPNCVKPLCGQACAQCNCAVDDATWALILAERERCYELAMLAPVYQTKCEEDTPELEMALKALAFYITLRIRNPDFDPERAAPAQGALFP